MDVYASPTATLKYPNISKYNIHPLVKKNYTKRLILFFVFRKRSSELKTRVCSWDFSPFGLTEQDLIHSVYLIFDQVLKLPELYHISITQGKCAYYFIFFVQVFF